MTTVMINRDDMLRQTEAEIRRIVVAATPTEQKVEELMKVVINERADILRDVCIRRLPDEIGGDSDDSNSG